jgi:cation diffusion facilitator CzcD-associated flavoprotein CzcO
MDLWRNHMPKGMMLKSEGFASNLSAPDGGSSLKDYCQTFGVPYADEGLPIPLDSFIAYADWFTAKHVPALEDKMVQRVDRRGRGFLLTLETGEQVEAENVILAVGITWFPVLPDQLASLPTSLVSHSYDHRTVDQFAGKRVVVIGAGASAINLAYELNEVGSEAVLVVRGNQVEYHDLPSQGPLRPSTS